MRYIFWTGGYNSTWRLLQSILEDRVRVQPVYLNQHCDSIDGFISRKNKHLEIEAMHKILEKMRKQYPSFIHLVNKPIFIDNLLLSKEVLTESSNLFHHYPQYFPRKVTEFSYLLQFSLLYNYNIEISYLSEDAISKIINIHLTEKNNLGKKENVSVFYPNLRFPLIKINRSELKDIAKKNNWESILNLTTSCWYPNSQGKPCMLCEYCRK